ncbi:MAG: hypothetical protein WA880_13540 [Ornithinimicrobium sp.]
MVLILLLCLVVALIMLVTIRFWGRPPVMNRVLVVTALGAAICVMLIRTTAVITGPNGALFWVGMAVLLMSLWLVKTGWDYTKPSKKR